MLSAYDQTSSMSGQTFRHGGGAAAACASNAMTLAVETDSLLLPFVRAAEDAEAERLLASLIEKHADPIIARIIGYKMRDCRSSDHRAEAEDVRGEVMLQLLQRLHNYRAEQAARPIRDFSAYVAAAAYNACDRHISRKYPQRRRLKNGLRYLLTHRPGFALWQMSDGSWVAGLHEWRAGLAHSRGKFGAEVACGRLQQLREDARAFARDKDARLDLSDRKNAYELLSAIFDWTAEPVELDLLTSVIAKWWGVTDETIEAEADTRDREEGRGMQLTDSRPKPSDEAERRLYLARLWREIVALPSRQRAALLLHLRDERGRACTDLLTLTGVAMAAEIAEAVGMTVEEFAGIWNELPLDDNRIAAHLCLTRQQVINLRKSARERLTRRMKDY